MRTRKLLLDLHDLLTAGLRDYPFPVPCVYGAAMEGGQPRSASEAFSAQNASESECCTGCAAERHLHDVRVFLHGLPEELGEGCYPFVVIRWAEGRQEDTQTQTLAHETVGFVLGVYAPENQEQAGLLTAELLDAVRQILWRNRLLAKMFELVPPLRSGIPSPKEKWNQYHMATVEAEWNYVLPPRGMGKNGAEYGISTGIR